MKSGQPLQIGITCYPSVGGSGILAASLGEQLALRGHEVHFISYERPFRMPVGTDRIHFHPVVINDYGLFKYPDYTLPLSVKMAEVSRDYHLDILHVHYAVPHATAAILARSMLAPGRAPFVVTTLHGTDTTLLGRDPGYGPAIRHALEASDAVTAVSEFLARETHRLLPTARPVEVIHNFFTPRLPARSRNETRSELGVEDGELLIVHASNLRPLKRIDLLLATAAAIRRRAGFRLLILAGGDFSPYVDEARRLGILDRIIVRAQVSDTEDYWQAADLALFTSETESFCLGILEAMVFGCPSVATAVGGIPEVVTDGETGWLVLSADPGALARGVEVLWRDPDRRLAMGRAGQQRAREHFSAEVIVPRYEALYQKLCSSASS